MQNVNELIKKLLMKEAMNTYIFCYFLNII